MSTVPFMRSVVFDLETVAAPDVADMIGPIHAPSHYKDIHKIRVYEIDKLAERIASASLEPDLCEIVAVGYDVGGGPHAFTRAELDEAGLIATLWEAIVGRRCIGYNILKFDLPVLIRRSQLLDIPVPTMVLDRYKTPHVDLLERLSFNGAITYRSLDFYCKRFGLEVPCDEYQGRDIPGLVAEGDWAAVLKHCAADIEKTTALAQRLGVLMPVPA